MALAIRATAALPTSEGRTFEGDELFCDPFRLAVLKGQVRQMRFYEAAAGFVPAGGHDEFSSQQRLEKTAGRARALATWLCRAVSVRSAKHVCGFSADIYS